MYTLMIRIALAILLLEALIVGGWNQFAPQGFYDNVPTVNLNPPFSDHFAHDFGGALLGIGALLLIALIKPKTHYVVPAAVAYSVFAVPHFFFHLFETMTDSAGQLVLLTTANAVVGVLGLLPIPLALLRDRRFAARAATA
ncbi:hypothetical protein [Amycolatopsis sp. FDAARGOS 1241]|uniref:hypothetical protein n=1 Tax=Amycolatopsis sp. FDAARGOS 1241 TaxID=2778070 RepID=UPI0019529DA7|nr:hypothetical protein [Amycolatopsis sp. FDAARGOS 1241]QRP48503.1 hypothetical protein I6J71_12045 [Amycolatopsis sp. FDAARGOS 1241]